VAYALVEATILKTFGTTAYQQDARSNSGGQQQAARLRLEYQKANRIARQDPGPLADDSLKEAQADYRATMKQVEDLEAAYRRKAAEPQNEQQWWHISRQAKTTGNPIDVLKRCHNQVLSLHAELGVVTLPWQLSSFEQIGR
jgi:ribosomal protein L16 Arg81 hydroxylase